MNRKKEIVNCIPVTGDVSEGSTVCNTESEEGFDWVLTLNNQEIAFNFGREIEGGEQVRSDYVNDTGGTAIREKLVTSDTLWL